jgi:hypothetical protein
MILEYSAPGARRRTHTAGATEAGPLGLLDVGNHELKVLKQGSQVNASFASGTAGIGYIKSGTFRKSHCERFTRSPRLSANSHAAKFGGAGRDRTADKGFADLCLTTWRPRLCGLVLEPAKVNTRAHSTRIPLRRRCYQHTQVKKNRGRRRSASLEVARLDTSDG